MGGGPIMIMSGLMFLSLLCEGVYVGWGGAYDDNV